MASKQETTLLQLQDFILQTELQPLEEKDIPHARQIKLSNGTDIISANIYTSGAGWVRRQGPAPAKYQRLRQSRIAGRKWSFDQWGAFVGSLFPMYRHKQTAFKTINQRLFLYSKTGKFF